MSQDQKPPSDSGVQSHAPNPLVEAAVKPLSENAEHRLTAISILAETADPTHPETPGGLYWDRFSHRSAKFLLYLPGGDIGISYLRSETLHRPEAETSRAQRSHIAPSSGTVRYADHALFMRAGLSAVAILLTIAFLLVFLFRFAFPPALREIAAAFVLALQRFTPLGGREWAIEHSQYVLPTTDLVAILLLILLTPTLFIRWRLSRRTAPLGIPCRPEIFSFLAILAVVALTFAAYPIVLKFAPHPLIIKALAAVPAFCLAVVFWNLLQAVIGKAIQRVSLAATAMALVPTYAVAIILVSLALPAYRVSEEKWLAKDTIQNLDPDLPDFGQYEVRLAAQKRRETRAILGLEN